MRLTQAEAALAIVLWAPYTLGDFNHNMLDDTVNLIKAKMEIPEFDLGELSSMYSQGLLQHGNASEGNNDEKAVQVLYSMMRQQHYRTNFSTTLWYGLVFWHDDANYWVYGPPPGNYLGLPPATYKGVDTWEGLHEAGDSTGCPDANNGTGPSEFCLQSYWLDSHSGIRIEPPHVSYWYDPWSPTRDWIHMVNRGKPTWLNAKINLWSSVPLIGGSTFIYDANGDFIGVTSAGLAVETFEEDLLRMVSSVPFYQTGGRLYIMTADTHEMVLASEKGVSWEEVSPWAPGPPISALNCTDEVIRQSAHELLSRDWATGQLFTSQDGRYFIDTRLVSSVSYRMDFEADWVFVVVQEVNCPRDWEMGGVEANYECRQCPSPKRSNGGAEMCTLCEESWFWDSDAQDCLPCPGGAKCNGGESLPFPLPGHWVDARDLSYLALHTHMECPLGDATCRGGDPLCFASESALVACNELGTTSSIYNPAVSCSEGAAGILCGSCAEAYFLKDGKSCKRCPKTLNPDVMIVSALALICIIAFSFKDRLADVMKALCLQSKFGESLVERFSGFVPDSDVIVWFKILWNGVTIVSTVHLDASFGEPADTLLGWMAALRFEFLEMEGLICHGGKKWPYPFRSLVYAIAGLVVFVVLNGLVFAARKFVSKQRSARTRSEEADQMTPHIATYLIGTYLIVPPVMSGLIQSWSPAAGRTVRDLVQDPTDPDLKSDTLASSCFLEVDTGIACDHQYDSLMGWLLLVYMMIPISWGVVLYQNRQRLNPKGDEQANLIQVRNNYRDPDLKAFRFLFRGYKPQWYLMEVLEVTRRLLFLAVLPIVSSLVVVRLVTGLVIAVAFTLLNYVHEPYTNAYANRVAAVVHFQICCTYFFAIVCTLHNQVLEPYPAAAAVGVIVFVVNLFIFSYMSYKAFGVWYSVTKAELELKKKEMELVKDQNSTALESWSKRSASVSNLARDVAYFEELIKKDNTHGAINHETLSHVVAVLLGEPGDKTHTASIELDKATDSFTSKYRDLTRRGSATQRSGRTKLSLLPARAQSRRLSVVGVTPDDEVPDDKAQSLIGLQVDKYAAAMEAVASELVYKTEEASGEDVISSSGLELLQRHSKTMKALAIEQAGSPESSGGTDPPANPETPASASLKLGQDVNTKRVLNPKTKGLINVCDVLISACTDKNLKEMRDLKWASISAKEEGNPPRWDLYRAQLAQLQRTVQTTETAPNLQKTGSLVNLYAHAAQILPSFTALLTQLEFLFDNDISVAPLQSGSDLVDRIVMSRLPAYRAIKNIRNVISATISLRSMKLIVDVADELVRLSRVTGATDKSVVKGKKIVITNVSDTFVTHVDEADGKRELLINFHFAEDEHQHIVEIRLVHHDEQKVEHLANEKLLRMRSKTVNLLRKLGLDEKDMRESFLREVRMSGERSLGELVHLGISASELLEAGYDERELVIEGIDNEELVDAKEKLAAEDKPVPSFASAKVTPVSVTRKGSINSVSEVGIPLVITGEAGAKKKKEVVALLKGVDIDDYYPEVMISYASGTRTGDTAGNGPGMYYAARVISILHKAGLESFSGLHVPPGQNWRIFMDKLDGQDSKARVLIVIVTPALYRSRACLEEIFFGMHNKRIELVLPVLFEEPIPMKKFMWSDEQCGKLRGDPKLWRRDVLAKFPTLNTIPAPGQDIENLDSVLTNVVERVKEFVEPKSKSERLSGDAKLPTATAPSAEAKTPVQPAAPATKAILTTGTRPLADESKADELTTNTSKTVIFTTDAQSSIDAAASSCTPVRKPGGLAPLRPFPVLSAALTGPTPSASALQMAGLSSPTSEASALQMLERVEKTIASLENKKESGKLSASKITKANVKLKKLRAKKGELLSLLEIEDSDLGSDNDEPPIAAVAATPRQGERRAPGSSEE